MFPARRFCPLTFISWQCSYQSKELFVIQGDREHMWHPRADTYGPANVGSALQRTVGS